MKRKVPNVGATTKENPGNSCRFDSYSSEMQENSKNSYSFEPCATKTIAKNSRSLDSRASETKGKHWESCRRGKQQAEERLLDSPGHKPFSKEVNNEGVFDSSQSMILMMTMIKVMMLGDHDEARMGDCGSSLGVSISFYSAVAPTLDLHFLVITIVVIIRVWCTMCPRHNTCHVS